LILLTLLLAAEAAATPARATLRLDYVHSGTAQEERFSVDTVVREGPWPGPPNGDLDTLDLGRYAFEVRDAQQGTLLYSRGFASIFGEWETTAEAKDRPRAFHESVRFPEPKAPARVVLKKRESAGPFREVWSVTVDPKDPLLDRAPAPATAKVWAVVENGPPPDKVDLLLLGDGYTAAEMEKWHADAKRMADLLFAVSPFKERRADFNVWAVDTPSDESGVSRPSDGVYHRSAVRATYDAFGSERYVLTFDNKRMREAASAAPYEFIEIVVNDRKYGGGGIHNLYATVAADNAFAPYLFVHEFAHHFAGLADEYYTSDVAVTNPATLPEPWEPNATADPQAAKWKALLTKAVPLPTPWSKAEFEAAQKDIQARRRKLRADHRPEAEMEALFREEKALVSKLLGTGPHAHAVGAFEGAMYEAKGYYRPQADCIMFTRDEVGFCAVCRRALEKVIDAYATRQR
jgi:hypothetical protein